MCVCVGCGGVCVCVCVCVMAKRVPGYSCSSTALRSCEHFLMVTCACDYGIGTRVFQLSVELTLYPQYVNGV